MNKSLLSLMMGSHRCEDDGDDDVDEIAREDPEEELAELDDGQPEVHDA